MEEVDYRELLTRYMRHVSIEEGTAFLGHQKWRRSKGLEPENGLTADDLKTLEEIEDAL